MTDTFEINTSGVNLMRETLKKAQEEDLAKIHADIRSAAVIYVNQGFRVIRLHGLSLTPGSAPTSVDSFGCVTHAALAAL